MAGKHRLTTVLLIMRLRFQNGIHLEGPNVRITLVGVQYYQREDIQ